MRLLRVLAKLSGNERGASTIEYAMICAFIIIAIFVSLQALAGQTIAMWTDIAARSSAATSKN
jgi:pilus assembly protein Flp/PilA